MATVPVALTFIPRNQLFIAFQLFRAQTWQPLQGFPFETRHVLPICRLKLPLEETARGSMPPSLGTHIALRSPALHSAGPGEIQLVLRSGQIEGIKGGVFCLWQNFLRAAYRQKLKSF